jgi:DNA-binding response OmpR family regulator
MVLRPAAPSAPAPAEAPMPVPSLPRRHAVIADEPREFRNFLGAELERAGFEVSYFDTGDAALARVRETRAELVILNVYLKGKLGVEISEEIKADPDLKKSKVVLIGALFRANRFRANPTNLYGADEYIEEQIPSKELQQMVRKLFPDVAEAGRTEPEPQPREFDEARRLARLILSDIVIYNTDKVDQGIREGTFFEVLKSEIEDGRQYYESRVPFKVRQKTEFFHETLQQFLQMKREELDKTRSGGRAG